MDRDPIADARTIRSGGAAATVDVAAGGRIARILVDGVDLLATPDSADVRSTSWGSFPMAPFAGRIRHGTFRYLGIDHTLETNHRDHRDGVPERDCHHAIHGTVFQRSWTIDRVTDDSISLSCPLVGELGWPFAGTARQSISIADDELRCELAIESERDAFPGEIGWHPWFVKPDRLHFRPGPPHAMYLQDELGLPTGELVVPPPGPWDDCFVHTGDVELEYARDRVSTVTVASDCDHWVIYDRPTHATCVEPQSGPPDACTIRPRLVAPGHELERWMTIAWVP